MKQALTIRSAWGGVFIVMLMILIAGHSPVLAQVGDTLLVNASPAGNLNNVIQGDTLLNGLRAHPNRTYELYRDSIYYIDATIRVNFPLSIIADSGSHRPPVIAPAIRGDNSSPSPYLQIFTGTKTLFLKFLYFTGVRPDQGLLGWADCIYYTSDSTNSKYSGCVFENFEEAAINDYSGKYNKFTITDCVFRNNMHPTSWFGGDAFLETTGGTPTDSVVIVNNTMFCNNSYADCNVDYNVYTKFEHNTVFLNGVNPLNDFVMTNAEYKNNIFYGTLAQAQMNSEIQQYYFENSISPSSTFSFDSLNTCPSHIPMAESQRRIAVFNNSVYWPAKLKAFWATPLMDTLTPPVFTNFRTTGMFNDKVTYPNLFIAGNDTVNDPGFPSAVLGQIDSLIKYVTLNRTNQLGTFFWYYNPNGHLFAPVWPLPENLAYSNTTLQHAGTDGFALGDLNWFPTQKAAWLLTDVKREESLMPQQFTLAQNYPNPFNPTTNISFGVRTAGHIKLVVYNVLGQLVRTLEDRDVTPGLYVATWDGRNDRGLQMASGVYFYQLVGKSFSMTKSMILMK